MGLRVLQAATVILAFVPTMTSALEGISRNEGDLRQTIIGTLLARNAGTGTLRAPVSMYRKREDSEMLQRLLELVHFGRTGPHDTIVNEAVATQGGWICPKYNQLPLRMQGCSGPADIPVHSWKNAFEVRQAAQQLGFSCNNPVKKSLSCSYKAKISQHLVKFSILPSIDGERSGPDNVYEVVADMRFDSRNGLTLTVTEKDVTMRMQ